MDQFSSAHEAAAAPAAASCPDDSVWAAIRDTSGGSADARFLDHVQACPACLGRLEAMAARLSRDDLLTESGRGGTPGADTLVARLLENPPTADPRPPAPVIDGLDDMVEVGRGGMGIVYRAHDTRLDRTVAVKVLSSAPALSAEARLLARIAHPNIVRIISVIDAQGLPAIVMEWIDGESLDTLGRRGGLPLGDAVRIVRDLSGAVAAMHEAGIVHRDIKPANVLIATATANGAGSGPGTPKLIDFGLARPDDEPGQAVTRAHITLGTPALMAPEQTGLDPALGPVGPATDIHGLGALLYWLLSGQVPYEGQTTAAVLKRAADGGVRPISTIVPRLPPDVGTIVAACLEREPARRYRSAAALADDLTRFLEGRPIRARRAGLFERGVMWARRRPAAAAVAAAGLLVAVAALAGVGHHLRSLARDRAAVAAGRTDAVAAAALARDSFAQLTNESADRFLSRGKPLDPAGRDYLIALRDHYRDWPLDPDPEAALHFRVAGLHRLTFLFERFNWKDDAAESRGRRAGPAALYCTGVHTCLLIASPEPRWPVIPPFLPDGLLPDGLHVAAEDELLRRFATASPQRSLLGRKVSNWIRLCRSAGALRLCVDGSFVTAKEAPNDADGVVLLGPDFVGRISRGHVDAILLAEILGARPDEHLFAAEDRRDWDEWIDFFSRTVDPMVRKGLVEVTL